MHDPNDPFGGSDEDRTIIRPNPGRRASAPSEATQFAPPQSNAPTGPVGPAFDIGDQFGLNSLEECATLLLNLLGQIRNTSSHPNPTALHQQLSSEIKQFETNASKAGMAPETIFTARYILCTIVDEFVLSTPWGASSVWRNQSLLRVFHQETSGGEKFFGLLQQLSKDPANNINLLELMYVCLALGFQGRYRVLTNGTSELEGIRETLYRTIRNHRGDGEMALSPNWQGVDKSLINKGAGFPLWAMASIALAVLGFVFVAMTFNLNRHSEPLYVALSTSGMEENLVPGRSLSPAPIRRIADPTPDRFNLKAFLEPEISRGEVTVDERADKTIVLIHGDGLFASGVDVIKSGYLPILERIGDGLEQTKGRIQIAGHSDNVPISTARFPSNRSLSQARADEVVRVLGQHMNDADRMTAIGLADSKPIVPNDTAQGRAQNRRVEIEVFERKRGA